MELLICFAAGGLLTMAGVIVGAWTAGKKNESQQSGHPTPAEPQGEEENRLSTAMEEGIQNLLSFQVPGQDGGR